MNSLPHQVPLSMFFCTSGQYSKQGRNDCEIACLYGGLTVVVGYGGVLFPEGYIVEITAHQANLSLIF